MDVLPDVSNFLEKTISDTQLLEIPID